MFFDFLSFDIVICIIRVSQSQVNVFIMKILYTLPPKIARHHFFALYSHLTILPASCISVLIVELLCIIILIQFLSVCPFLNIGIYLAFFFFQQEINDVTIETWENYNATV